ncbi:hypothetical protein [Pantoea eucalypti]|uniref:hypothetical protein n=1 Tax=Pantoea eucalypti TaxID=470933 RepID=UPI00289F50EA|nr:hypothetical protein [Pantoea eucalypti]
MASFTVRVELRGADWEAYEKLHTKMLSAGYYREVTGYDGLSYQLPDAEYAAEKNITVEQVRDEVINIARSLNFDPGVLVSETVRWSWLLKQA